MPETAPVLVTTNNSTVLRELNTPPFQRLGMTVWVAQDAEEAYGLVAKHCPGAALLDVELPGESGYALCRRIKENPELAGTRVVLLVDGSITAPVIAELSASRCDEVLSTPMTADALFHKVTQLMGIPGRARRRMTVSLEVGVEAERGSASGRVVDLNQDGARLLLDRALPLGAVVTVRIGGAGETTGKKNEAGGADLWAGEVEVRAEVVWAGDVEVAAEVVWAARDEGEGGWACGLKFLEPDLAARTALGDLSLWDVSVEPDGTLLVTFQGDFREHTDLSRLIPRLTGRVVFDMSWVRYINSAGVRHWVRFVRGLTAVESYRFVRCSVAFVTQVSMVPEAVGRGVVESVMVPFACDDCELEEERLVQTAVLQGQGSWPPDLPAFMCPRCGGELAFDDVPARYFAFLEPAT